MCLVCRRRQGKNDLLRFVADADGSLRQDMKFRLPGRGAYCCRTEECVSRFVRQERRLANALRRSKIKIDELVITTPGPPKVRP